MLRGFLSLLLLAVLAFAFGRLSAEPLDAATCGQLKGEQARMEQVGVRVNMARGPEWAKANLAADKLDQIRRLIELDEQLLFRCSSRNLVELPPDADADPAPVKTDEEGKTTATPKADDPPAPAAKSKPGTAKAAPAPPAKAPAVKTQPKAAAKTAPEAPKAAPAKKPESAKAAAGTAPVTDKAAAAKPKPKAKVDDAYKPPPPDPNVDPFANQPARQQ